MGLERHAESGLNRSRDRLFELPSRGWFVFQPPQLVAARGCPVSLRVNPVRLPQNLVAVRENDVWLRWNDVRLLTGFIFNHLRRNHLLEPIPHFNSALPRRRYVPHSALRT